MAHHHLDHHAEVISLILVRTHTPSLEFAVRILTLSFTFFTIYVCFRSFDHIDGLITDRVVRYCCQKLMIQK